MADDPKKDANEGGGKVAGAGTGGLDAATAAASVGTRLIGKPTGALRTWIGHQAIHHSTLAWLLVLVLWALTATAAYFAWFVVLPDLWSSTGGSPFRILGAVFGTVLLLYLPALVGMPAYAASAAVAEASLSPDALRLQNAKDQLQETEQDAIDRLEDTEMAGLVPLLRYSRAQLDEYYAMGLGQTKRSFRQALIAMWLGFTLLILGLALYVGPVEKLGIQRPSQDFNILMLSTAAIIEFISVLFLWIYRSTMGQLTFYYRLQIRNHNSILGFRMAMGMKTGADEARRAIIDSMLDSSLLPERIAVEGSGGLRAWLRPQTPPPPPPPPPPPASS